MDIQVNKSDKLFQLSIDGRLDTITAVDFEAAVVELLEEKPAEVIINCSKLEYISSSGLRIFLLAQKKMLSGGGKLKLCCLQPAIKEIFDISGFSSIFSIFDDLEMAKGSH